MGLSSATNVTQSSIATIAAQVNVVSQNIAGANTPGYAEQTANIATTIPSGGVQLTSVTNSQNQALFDSVLSATSSSAAQNAISQGLSTLQQTIGDTSSTTSPSAQISALIDALQQYESQPSNSSLAASTVTAASTLAATLNNATTTVQQMREQADSEMAASVSSINSLLTQFGTVNSQIVSGTALGQNVNALLDTRNSILTQLSQQVGISTVTGANNDMSIYTDSGVTLFPGGVASTVTFQPTGTYTASTTGNAVYIDGIAVTGASAVMPIQSGALAGLANLRDNIAVTYQIW
jgi:flagellar hook-associated protein 1